MTWQEIRSVILNKCKYFAAFQLHLITLHANMFIRSETLELGPFKGKVRTDDFIFRNGYPF
jgi:hypothetical protein